MKYRSYSVCVVVPFVAVIASLILLTTNGEESWSPNRSTLRHRKLIDMNTNVGKEDTSILNEYILKLNATHLTSHKDVRTTIESLLQSAATDDAGVGVGRLRSNNNNNSDVSGHIMHIYDHIFQGAAIKNVSKELLKRLLDQNIVEYISPNRSVRGMTVAQKSPVWNLDRIDQIDYPLDLTFAYNYTGKGVYVFVLDSGILATHSEFQGRVRSRVYCGFNAISHLENCTDLNGHGTHVAATIGGKTFGVAKDVTLINVKVLDKTNYGTFVTYLAGLNYVLAFKKGSGKNIPMVINMSVIDSKTTPGNEAVNAAVDAGIFVAAAAGNDANDACNYSPSSAEKAVTVSAFGVYNNKASSFTNQGGCVNIFAPGELVISASIACTTCNSTKSGTSVATPHVAGAAALYFSKNKTLTPARILSAMQATAVKDKLEGVVSGTPNLQLTIKID